MNTMHTELKGTLYIGFPKSLSYQEAESILWEIGDYIDNNEDLSLEGLTQDDDYKHLDIHMDKPTPEQEQKYFYMDLEIADLSGETGLDSDHSNQYASLNIDYSDLQSVCSILAESGYQYQEYGNYWKKSV